MPGYKTGSKFTALLFLLLISFQSCCISTKNISLGNGFKLSEFSLREVSIMYCEDKCCDVGTTVIPQTIIAYNFDNDWIIALTDSTYDNNRKDFAYWIFNKNISSGTEKYSGIKANIMGPMDSLAFYATLKEKGIRLRLMNYQSETR